MREYFIVEWDEDIGESIAAHGGEGNGFDSVDDALREALALFPKKNFTIMDEKGRVCFDPKVENERDIIPDEPDDMSDPREEI